MSTIDRLTEIDELATGDQLPVFSIRNGDSRKATLTTLLDFLSENLSVDRLVTQYAAPSASGFSVSITQNNTHLILTPAAGYAAGTIVLPIAPVDRDELLVNSTQAVTTLTFSGGTVIGGPTGLAANDYFRLKYDSLLSRWYRIG
jgi:hypothetical protein